MDFWNQSKHQQLPEPQTKRISTPAGQRLSVILENGSSQGRARDSHRASTRKSGLSMLVGDVPQESSEEQSNNSYTYSVWSDGEKFAALKNHKQVTKRGGWRRVALIALVVLLLIIALAVGLALGLKKKGSNSNNPASSGPAAAATQTSDPSTPTKPTGTSAPAASSLPSNFPVGSYSLITFLDTVQTNCTSLSSTWTCYPYTEYNTDHTKSAATFNWIISGSAPNYQISSTTNPFSINFKNVDLKLEKEGQDDESYRFQLQMKKTVSPTTSVTKDKEAVECDYADTSFTAWLYTKKASTYPDTAHGDGDGDPAFPVWPFGVKVEQVAAGNPDVPSCHKTSSPQTPLTDITEPQENGQLCSCLYRNWKATLPT